MSELRKEAIKALTDWLNDGNTIDPCNSKWMWDACDGRLIWDEDINRVLGQSMDYKAAKKALIAELMKVVGWN